MSRVILIALLITIATIANSAEIGIVPVSSKFTAYFIDGELKEGDAEHFEKLLMEKPPQGENYQVYLNSNGGLLLEGIKLGLIFRKYKLWTNVERIEHSNIYPYPIPADEAYCASACAIAFLGGVQRRLSRDNELGFHQFYDSSSLTLEEFTKDKQNEISGQSQYISALLANYLFSLGDIDPKILILNASVPSNQMYWLTRQEAMNLNVINEKLWSRIWLEPYGNGLVAASRRSDAETGYERFRTGDYVAQVTFFCRGNQNFLMLSAKFISTTDDETFITIKSIDEFGKVISSQSGDTYRVRTVNDAAYLDIELDEQILNSLNNAKILEVDAGLFVHADQRVTLELNSMDRKSILTALKLCI